ncbi:MAG: hypothetical protein D3916_11160 [Candidatus Electrothrix sp. MAN1_4]|nr:hypothetical protein [Candidatus Electrothrix sp. MAN1_4]
MKVGGKKQGVRSLWHAGLLNLLLFSLLSLILSACGPMYKTEYMLEPPTSQQGKLCIMQCEQNWSECKNEVKSDNKDCQHRNEIASLKLEQCIKSGERACYDPRTPCLPPSFEQCNKEYRYCFQSCGGKVVPQVTCVDSWGWGVGCN